VTAGLSRDAVKRLLYGAPGMNRFTQDSPVLLDVWNGFAEQPAEAWSDGRPGKPLDLLIEPFGDEPAHAVADAIDRRVQAFRTHRGETERPDADVSDVPGTVAACLHLDEVTNVILPITPWWQDLFGGNGSLTRQGIRPGESLADALIELLPHLNPFREEKEQPRSKGAGPEDNTWRILLLIALIGIPPDGLRLMAEMKDGEAPPGPLDERIRANLAARLDPVFVASEMPRKLVFLVTCNRRPRISEERRTARDMVSAITVKADAARHLFDTCCREIVWAVIDSGIDVGHDAFVDFDAPAPGSETEPRPSRVRRAYDFTRLRQLRSRDQLRRIFRLPPERRKLAEELAGDATADLTADRIDETLLAIAQDAQMGRPLDWEKLEPLIAVPRSRVPVSPHGTHVAGILGAGPGSDCPRGVAPDIGLMDFRVVDPSGQSSDASRDETEFAILAALRFIRHLNARNDWLSIHGVNMSLSLEHEVDNYACGRTPVCIEAERLVANGVVVVAAAGNRGYLEMRHEDGIVPIFTASSITDPGNAHLVITVGSTHRREPHAYGVSYFSSRGPTADGRVKPDIVAPGEKILSAAPNNSVATLGGTSMAAPHVSGAAALLMARFPELIGRPREIKRILCESATDLGRERYFQGSGLLDILRAMQSI
jgi:hypothetical protein